jgi:hypothetical protein
MYLKSQSDVFSSICLGKKKREINSMVGLESSLNIDISLRGTAKIPKAYICLRERNLEK